MKKFFFNVSVVIAAVSYLWIINSTIETRGQGMTFSTFMLWSILAWILCFTTMKQGTNPGVIVMYGIGASTVSTILAVYGKYGWSGLDTVVSALVVICLFIWWKIGPRAALITSIVAGTIAFIPYVTECWRHPELSPIVANIGFLAANAVGFMSARAWTIQDRLYLGVNTVMCALLVLPWILIRI